MRDGSTGFPFARLALLLSMCFDYRHMPPTTANRKQHRIQPRYPHSNEAVIRTPALAEKCGEEKIEEQRKSFTQVLELDTEWYMP